MDLLEYQAKELFRQVGIPVLPSQQIYDPRDLKQLKISYPIVLKSQVRVGGRGKAGGIKFVNNTIDAIAAARTIFNLPILGEYPQVLLAESRYNAESELFLAIVLDYELKKPVLLGSASGGIDVKSLLENLQKVVVDGDFYPFYARRLAIKMGLKGKPLLSIGSIIEKMYYLFLRKDLDLIEINPLGIDKAGEVMALDGKINVNDCGLTRHDSLLDLIKTKPKNININKQDKKERVDRRIVLLDGIDDKGNIALVCGNLDLALVAWDATVANKGKIACCYAIKEGKEVDLFADIWLKQQLESTLDKIGEIRSVKTVLFDLLGDRENSTIIVKLLVEYLQTNLTTASTIESSSSRTKKIDRLQFVLRLSQNTIELVKDLVAGLPVYICDDLETAVDRVIASTKIK